MTGSECGLANLFCLHLAVFSCFSFMLVEKDIVSLGHLIPLLIWG